MRAELLTGGDDLILAVAGVKPRKLGRVLVHAPATVAAQDLSSWCRTNLQSQLVQDPLLFLELSLQK